MIDLDDPELVVCLRPSKKTWSTGWKGITVKQDIYFQPEDVEKVATNLHDQQMVLGKVHKAVTHFLNEKQDKPYTFGVLDADSFSDKQIVACESALTYSFVFEGSDADITTGYASIYFLQERITDNQFSTMIPLRIQLEKSIDPLEIASYLKTNNQSIHVVLELPILYQEMPDPFYTGQSEIELILDQTRPITVADVKFVSNTSHIIKA